jgi:hypothetical protein
MPKVEQSVERKAAEELLKRGGILLSDVSAARKNRILTNLCEALQRRSLYEKLELQFKS